MDENTLTERNKSQNDKSRQHTNDHLMYFLKPTIECKG